MLIGDFDKLLAYFIGCIELALAFWMLVLCIVPAIGAQEVASNGVRCNYATIEPGIAKAIGVRKGFIKMPWLLTPFWNVVHSSACNGYPKLKLNILNFISLKL